MNQRGNLSEEAAEAVRRWHGYGWNKIVISRFMQRRFEVYILPREIDRIIQEEERKTK